MYKITDKNKNRRNKSTVSNYSSSGGHIVLSTQKVTLTLDSPRVHLGSQMEGSSSVDEPHTFEVIIIVRTPGERQRGETKRYARGVVSPGGGHGGWRGQTPRGVALTVMEETDEEIG
ncbi:hypothetical protein RRG08_065981 [Elysia crispata]|uniref:Uncharacterized protein n=1 Tax=Elysia crispata TaxID=231223 RepID=A0AAE1A4X7_9GAST|nr:hypothetical protein RRG08_065981 [Elysia crispata]